MTRATKDPKDCMACQSYALEFRGDNVFVKDVYLVDADKYIGEEKKGKIMPTGEIVFTGTEQGFAHTETWTVLYLSQYTLMFKYCNIRTVDGTFTEGYRVLNRNGEMTIADDDAIGHILPDGVEDQMCLLNPIAACNI